MTLRARTAQSLAAAALVALLLVAAAEAYRARRRRAERFTLARTQAVRAAADGQEYRVHLVHGDAAGAAETLAELNRRSVELMRHLRDKYLRGPLAGRAPPARAQAVRRLLARYNPDNIAENSPRDPEGDTSYTVDKGGVLALCLRERAGSDALHDLETLTFVTFHELAHIAIEEVDHPPRFWQAFKFLLAEGAEAGLLAGVDYGRRPVKYCGLDVDYNPLYDPALPLLA